MATEQEISDHIRRTRVEASNGIYTDTEQVTSHEIHAGTKDSVKKTDKEVKEENPTTDTLETKESPKTKRVTKEVQVENPPVEEKDESTRTD